MQLQLSRALLLCLFLQTASSLRLGVPFIKLQRAVAVIAIGSTLGFLPDNADAASRRGDGASGLFAEAEQSMTSTIKTYKEAKEEWGTARKMVDVARQELGSGKASLQSIFVDTTSVVGKMTAISTEQADVSSKIAEQITAQQATTALKYQAAEAAAAPESRKRPAYTASLFQAAQSSADTLARIEGLLKDYKEVEGATDEASKRVSKIAADVGVSIQRLSESEAELATGSQQLEGGVSPALVERSSDNFREISVPTGSSTGSEASGSKLFSLGVTNVDQATNKGQGALKGLREACNALEGAGTELSRLDSRLSSVSSRNGDWEKETRLSAGKAGQLVATTSTRLQQLASLSEKTTERACSAADKRDESLQKTKKSRLTSVLRSVQSKLEQAERKAGETESLIRQASQKGAEEASRYRRFIPAPPAPVSAK